MVTDQFIGAYGLGDYDAITLRKLLTGKQAQAGVSISGLSESVGGASTPNDFETLMQLFTCVSRNLVSTKRFTKP